MLQIPGSGRWAGGGLACARPRYGAQLGSRAGARSRSGSGAAHSLPSAQFVSQAPRMDLPPSMGGVGSLRDRAPGCRFLPGRGPAAPPPSPVPSAGQGAQGAGLEGLWGHCAPRGHGWKGRLGPRWVFLRLPDPAPHHDLGRGLCPQGAGNRSIWVRWHSTQAEAGNSFHACGAAYPERILPRVKHSLLCCLLLRFRGDSAALSAAAFHRLRHEMRCRLALPRRAPGCAKAHSVSGAVPGPLRSPGSCKERDPLRTPAGQSWPGGCMGAV